MEEVEWVVELVEEAGESVVALALVEGKLKVFLV